GVHCLIGESPRLLREPLVNAQPHSFHLREVAGGDVGEIRRQRRVLDRQLAGGADQGDDLVPGVEELLDDVPADPAGAAQAGDPHAHQPYGPNRPQAITAAAANSTALVATPDGSLRRMWVAAASSMSIASPVAAIGVRMGAMPVAAGRISPSAPSSSTMPMNRTVPGVKSSTHCSSGRSFCFGWVAFMTPAMPNAAASRIWTIHRNTCMRQLSNEGRGRGVGSGDHDADLAARAGGELVQRG